jgi:hypothetical protein
MASQLPRAKSQGDCPAKTDIPDRFRDGAEGSGADMEQHVENKLASIPAEVIARWLIRDDDEEGSHWTDCARALVAGLIEHERETANSAADERGGHSKRAEADHG